MRLPCPRDGRLTDVEVRQWHKGPGGAGWRSASREWFSYRRLPDGSASARWRGLSEFTISANGASIRWRRLAHVTDDTFRGFLLPQVLSFSLIARGREPLHGSAVAVDGEVVAFLGDCGQGKSSLTAAFLQAGFPLVTDDLLVLSRRGRGYRVEPGIPSLKLVPRLARRLLQVRAAPRVAPGATKLLIPVPPSRRAGRSLPLHTLYILSRGRAPRIAPVTPAAAFVEIVRDTFNTVQMDSARLASQFRFARQLATTARVRLLEYPRRLDRIAQVRDLVLSDCGIQRGER